MSDLERKYTDEKYDGGAGAEVVPAGENSATAVDAVWGELDGKGPNYRGLGWVRTIIVMLKIQVGLGVLAMPSFIDTLGFVPGLIVILVIGILITWTDWIVGEFKLSHPEVYTLADVGEIIWGPVGREILFVGYWLYLVFVAGAGLLAASTAFNALSDHGACTAIFVFVSAAIVAIIASIRTLDRISWLTWVGASAILISVLILAIAVGVQDRPAAAPLDMPMPIDLQVKIWPTGTFQQASASIAAIIFSYAGTPAFFSIVSEMRDPKKYTHSLIGCQTIVVMIYMIIGSVVYHFCGIYVSSPALGSAGHLFKKICYGFALPGLIMGAVLNTHIPAKLLFVRFLRGTRHLTHGTALHYGTWFGCIAFNASISFLIAESIPVFNNLLSCIGAFLATPLSLTVEAYMFYWEYKRRRSLGLVGPLTFTQKLIHAFNFLVFVLSFFFIGTGIWASIMAIRGDVLSGNTSKPFSCSDNSG